jgi:AraC family transcriptional regulator of arabinose operon
MTAMAIDFRCYLPPPAVPGPWGLDLRAGGRALTGPHQPYPALGHPQGYDFAWERGRIMGQFALNLIVRGGGTVIDAQQQVHEVRAGQAFLTLPGRWHTYRPHGSCGWEEHWLAFTGPSAQRILESLSTGGPIHDAGAGLGRAIIEATVLLEQQPAGFLAQAEAWLAQALSCLAARRTGHQESRGDAGLRLAAIRLQQGPASIESLARECGLSPAQFRRRFHAATGHSPRDYAVLVRMERAKEQLLIPGASVRMVAEKIGFSSASFFSRLFARHCGCPPRIWQSRQGGTRRSIAGDHARS